MEVSAAVRHIYMSLGFKRLRVVQPVTEKADEEEVNIVGR